MRLSLAASVLTVSSVITQCQSHSTAKQHQHGMRTSHRQSLVRGPRKNGAQAVPRSRRDGPLRNPLSFPSTSYVKTPSKDFVECDPKSSSADIGVLCGNERYYCHESSASSIGGFCGEELQPSLPYPASRLLEEGAEYEYEYEYYYAYIAPRQAYYWCGGDEDYAHWNCNCDGWDENTLVGNITDCGYEKCSYCEGGNCAQTSFWVDIKTERRLWHECSDYGDWKLCKTGTVVYATETFTYDCTFEYRGTEYCCYFVDDTPADECGYRNCEGSTFPFEICDLKEACPDLDAAIPWATRPTTESPTPAPTASTTSPTKAPTYFPTLSPTPGPTNYPTEGPTSRPTVETSSPSSSPSDGPSSGPTQNLASFTTISEALSESNVTDFNATGDFLDDDFFLGGNGTDFSSLSNETNDIAGIIEIDPLGDQDSVGQEGSGALPDATSSNAATDGNPQRPFTPEDVLEDLEASSGSVGRYGKISSFVMAASLATILLLNST